MLHCSVEVISSFCNLNSYAQNPVTVVRFINGQRFLGISWYVTENTDSIYYKDQRRKWA
jgi:hypothetical protein